MKELSDKDGRTSIWLPLEVKKKAKGMGLKVSQICKDAIIEVIKKEYPGFRLDPPEFMLLVRCPYCQDIFQTISIHIVRCKWCKKRFRVLTARAGSRIHKIIKGEDKYRAAAARKMGSSFMI